MALKHKNDTNDGGTQKIKFENLDITNSSENDEDGKKLLNKCKEVASMPPGETDEEKNIRRLREWCVMPNTADTATVPVSSNAR